jgi:hypothetical protein
LRVSRRFPSLDHLVSVILADHLPYLVAYLLPIVNEIARLASAHYISSLLFEDRENGFRIGSIGIALLDGYRSE